MNQTVLTFIILCLFFYLYISEKHSEDAEVLIASPQTTSFPNATNQGMMFAEM